jgi:hypothetical protein
MKSFSELFLEEAWHKVLCSSSSCLAHRHSLQASEIQRGARRRRRAAKPAAAEFRYGFTCLLECNNSAARAARSVQRRLALWEAQRMGRTAAARIAAHTGPCS